MAKKSPIKNLASSVAGVHRSTLSQLLDSASNAVHQGAQLSQHIVVAASSANKRKQPRDNKTEASAAPAARKGDDKKAITASTPPKLKSDSGGGVRVRDAIHMFDTAASSSKTKNTKEQYASPSVTNNTSSSYHAAASFRHSPYRNYRGVAMKRDDEVGQNDEQHCHHHHHNSGKGSSSNQYCDKENSSNNLEKSDKDRHQSLAIKNKWSAATLASANAATTEHASSPKKSSNLRLHPRHPTTTVSIHGCEPQTTRTMLDSVVKKCSTSSGVQRGSTTRRTDNYDSDGLEAEVGGDARKGQGIGSNGTNDVLHSPKQRDKDKNTDVHKEDDLINFNVEQKTTTKKRASPHTTRDESTIRIRATPAKKCHHPLIQSPLRKHIKSVHDSACANASCTMIKEPFPLLVLPPLSYQPREARASDHNFLDTLDALTTTTMSVPTKIDTTGKDINTTMMMKDGEGDQDKWQGNSSCSSKKEEEAIDLLTSASFLFQQSRRKLG